MTNKKLSDKYQRLSAKYQALTNFFKYLEDSGYSEGYEVFDNGNGVEIKKELHQWLQDGLKGKRLIEELEDQKVCLSIYGDAGYFDNEVEA